MADDTPTSPLPEVPESFDALTDEAMRSLHGELAEARTALLAERSTEGVTLTRLREIREQVKAADAALARIVTEVSDRIEVANELQADADAAPSELPEVIAPAAADLAPEASDENAGEPLAGVGAVATAGLSAEDIAGNRDSSPQVPPAGQARARTPLVMTAGQESLMDGDDVDYDAIARLIDGARGRVAQGNRVVLAGLAPYELDPNVSGVAMLTDGQSARVNDRIMREATEEWRGQFDERNAANAKARRAGEPITAAICDPLDIIREIPDSVQSSEPLSDSLPSRAIGRLGFQFTPPILLADISDGVFAAWDDTEQSNVDPDDPATWKPTVFVDCPTPSHVRAEFVGASMFFDITTDMSNPERIRDAMSKLRAQKARSKTARLLQLLDTFTHHFSFPAPYGALPGIVQAILTTLPQGEYPERLDDTPYLVYTPPGLLETLTIDKANRGYGVAMTQADVIGYIEATAAEAGWNLRVVDLEDVSALDSAPFSALPAVGISAVPLPPLGGEVTPFKVRVVAPESFIYGSTGEIETGIERSPDLQRRNQAQWFMEEGVLLAKHGSHPSYTLHLDLCADGSRAGLVDPFACPGEDS